jgi:hypothetical protein
MSRKKMSNSDRVVAYLKKRSSKPDAAEMEPHTQVANGLKMTNKQLLQTVYVMHRNGDYRIYKEKEGSIVWLGYDAEQDPDREDPMPPEGEVVDETPAVQMDWASMMQHVSNLEKQNLLYEHILRGILHLLSEAGMIEEGK